MERTDIQEAIFGVAAKCPGYEGNCARSAKRHLDKAWLIRDLDPEMALFRAITADEEACSALFRALRRLKYDGAKNLNANDHVHKAAVRPFLGAVAGAMIPLEKFGTELIVETVDGRDVLKTRLTVPGPNGKFLYAYPDPPLDFTLDVDGRRHDFVQEARRLVQRLKTTNLRRHVKARAQLRNRLLYATPEGVPEVQGSLEAELRKRNTDVVIVLGILGLVTQSEVRQTFVEQCLAAFLDILESLSDIRGEIGDAASD